MSTHAANREFLGLSLPATITTAQRRSLIAGGLGWMLDAMDVMLYSLVLSELMREFGMTTATAGLLNSLTLFSSALGGIVFGILADRVGRVRSLMASILVYSIASGLCGLSANVTQLAIFRVILGLGMGGEWGTGAALIAETWPTEHRGKALGLMQSMWAVGEMLAIGATAIVLPTLGWRAVFFVGVLPALVAVWVRRSVAEPEIWTERADKGRVPFKILLRPDLRRNGLIATAMNACSMFGYWGLFTWIPAYLSLPVAQGGRGLGLMATTTWLLVMGVGKWFGYASYGVFADHFGRRRAYSAYLLIAALLVPLYGSTTDASLLLILGPLVAFFGTGYFSGFGTIASELFPTEIRATAMGLTYNIGRGFSAAAPFIVGSLAQTYGLGPAFLLQGGAFLLAALLALFLPETKGRALT